MSGDVIRAVSVSVTRSQQRLANIIAVACSEVGVKPDKTVKIAQAAIDYLREQGYIITKQVGQ